MLTLSKVTLVGIDGCDADRLLIAARISQYYCKFAYTHLFTSRNVHNCISAPPTLSIEEYCQFVLKSLHTYIKTSHVLIIQHDGFVLNPQSWRSEFLDYDYVGAPFWFPDELNVGNGGFSLRSKRLLEATSEIVSGPPWSPEDLIICRQYRRRLEQMGLKFAPLEVARQFSIDGNHREGYQWNGQFGFHNLRTTSLSHWVPPPLKLGGLEVLKREWDIQQKLTKHIASLRKRCMRLEAANEQILRRIDRLESNIGSSR